MEHKVYTAIKLRGASAYPFGKCLCGAHLANSKEIEEHKLLDGKKILEDGDADD